MIYQSALLSSLSGIEHGAQFITDKLKLIAAKKIGVEQLFGFTHTYELPPVIHSLGGMETG